MKVPHTGSSGRAMGCIPFARLRGGNGRATMVSRGGRSVRVGESADAERIGRLLFDFNTEFQCPTPTAERLSGRIRELLAEGHTAVLLGGEGPDALAVLRFRPGIWTQALECYLAELYVAPDQRGRGLGRELMQAAMELARRRGADRMDLTTGDDDTVARALYESLGFSKREGGPDGPVNYFYEREL
jgi:ribosomal protein S18 acetylase RimI-like enzyme